MMDMKFLDIDDEYIDVMVEMTEVPRNDITTLAKHLDAHSFHHGLLLRRDGVSLDNVLQLYQVAPDPAKLVKEMETLSDMYPGESIDSLARLYIDQAHALTNYVNPVRADGLIDGEVFVGMDDVKGDDRFLDGRTVKEAAQDLFGRNYRARVREASDFYEGRDVQWERFKENDGVLDDR